MKKPKARNASVDWTIAPAWRSRSASRLRMMISGPMPAGSLMVMAQVAEKTAAQIKLILDPQDDVVALRDRAPGGGS